MGDDVVVAAEDAVGEPVVAEELPGVLDRVELDTRINPVGLGRFVIQVPRGMIEGTGSWTSEAFSA